MLSGALLPLAACSPGEEPRVTVIGGACGDDYGPALDNWVASMDTNNDNVINSDEFNSAFSEAEDTVDGKLDISELRGAVCGP
jgi:hypothetical protein